MFCSTPCALMYQKAVMLEAAKNPVTLRKAYTKRKLHNGDCDLECQSLRLNSGAPIHLLEHSLTQIYLSTI